MSPLSPNSFAMDPEPSPSPALSITERRDFFSPIPTELILEITCNLFWLRDALVLSATARRYREVFNGNANVILHSIGIPVLRRARQLLADQGGAGVNTLATRNDILVMLRNEQAMDRAVEKFEKHVVHGMRLTRVDCQRIYGAAEHPPHLTRTERIRFIRSWYDIWSFMLIPQSQWRQRLNTMTSLKQLELLIEMCRLTALNPTAKASDLLSMFVSESIPDASAARLKVAALRAAVADRASSVYRARFGFGVATGQCCTFGATGRGSAIFPYIWDHAQECCLRNQVTRPRLPPYNESSPRCEPKEHLWDEDTDDELARLPGASISSLSHR